MNLQEALDTLFSSDSPAAWSQAPGSKAFDPEVAKANRQEGSPWHSAIKMIVEGEANNNTIKKATGIDGRSLNAIRRRLGLDAPSVGGAGGSRRTSTQVSIPDVFLSLVEQEPEEEEPEEEDPKLDVILDLRRQEKKYRNDRQAIRKQLAGLEKQLHALDNAIEDTLLRIDAVQDGQELPEPGAMIRAKLEQEKAPAKKTPAKKSASK